MSSQIPAGEPSKGAENFGRRNPYELRFDLLHLAKDILEQNVHLKMEQAKNSSNIDISQCELKFTAEDVIEEAKKLNAFVSANK